MTKEKSPSPLPRKLGDCVTKGAYFVLVTATSCEVCQATCERGVIKLTNTPAATVCNISIKLSICTAPSLLPEWLRQRGYFNIGEFFCKRACKLVRRWL